VTADAAGVTAAAALLALLEAAAADGHTVVPSAVASSALVGVRLRLEVALREIGPAGSALVCEPSPELLGLRRLVDAERALAGAVHALAAAGSLHVVVGPPGGDRDRIAADLGGPNAAILDDAEYLDVETFAAFFSSCADDENVVLVGDSDGLRSPGPGQPFDDIAASGLVDVVRAGEDPAVAPALRELAAAIRRGELPVGNDPDRAVVIVRAASASEAIHRAGQLVADSIPRALGIAPSDIQVLAPNQRGPGGSDELAAALGRDAVIPSTVQAALGGRWPAVVVVLAPHSAGVLTRALIYSAVTRATAHLSIVQASGAAFGQAVTSVSRRPRRTMLATLLRS
jgi:UvrD-like helicase C-terminal domain/AAA domain